ncbi:citrate/2-methylcitrate synthase [Smaragdicoccus niigatensis]|uniref:citrate/2-methylcitrate synthase n=1 Tax=Smaragdicoccus niigatensis TaxID=359359 RepID=UPI00036A4A7D|nr:citrate/2-methylcitrate synthase [Smaragdicoccus niigatensis]
MDTITVAPRGLHNVVVADTEIGDVRGDEGFYHYRQYPAVELARTQTFEDVWFLFAHGHLPSASERERFTREVAELRTLPPEIEAALPTIAAIGDRPLVALRTALSLIGQTATPLYDATEDEKAEAALRICAITPTLLAALHRLSLGLPVVASDPSLRTAANWLYMVTGERPGEAEARAIEQYLIATIDHGFNASTFTARVVASTGADLVSAVVAAIGAFSGPLHGGAPDRALDALDEIGSPANAAAWVRRQVESGDRIMGFGHAVYRTLDPRSELLREIAVGLGGDTVERAVAIENTVVETLAELKPGRKLYANVEYYAGVVMDRCGLPRSMFTPTFACSRIVGWSANVVEQSHDRKIIRPSARYVGPDPEMGVDLS